MTTIPRLEDQWFQEEQELAGRTGQIRVDQKSWPIVADPGMGHRKNYLSELSTIFDAKKKATLIEQSRLNEIIKELESEYQILTERVSQLTAAGETISSDYISLASTNSQLRERAKDLEKKLSKDYLDNCHLKRVERKLRDKNRELTTSVKGLEEQVTDLSTTEKRFARIVRKKGKEMQLLDDYVQTSEYLLETAEELAQARTELEKSRDKMTETITGIVYAAASTDNLDAKASLYTQALKADRDYTISLLTENGALWNDWFKVVSEYTFQRDFETGMGNTDAASRYASTVYILSPNEDNKVKMDELSLLVK